MLEIDGIAAAYGNIEALRGVDLSVEEGGITCLLGPNGAGKTTLMMTIAGILKAEAGHHQLSRPEHYGHDAERGRAAGDRAGAGESARLSRHERARESRRRRLSATGQKQSRR